MDKDAFEGEISEIRDILMMVEEAYSHETIGSLAVDMDDLVIDTSDHIKACHLDKVLENIVYLVRLEDAFEDIARAQLPSIEASKQISNVKRALDKLLDAINDYFKENCMK
jgi:hypothetical protein